MAIMFGDKNNNTIAAAAAGTTIFGMSGADTLSSAFATADLRGGWGADTLTATFMEDDLQPGQPSLIRWSVSGDQGNDTISLSNDMVVTTEDAVVNVDVEFIIDGGDGNDSISIFNSINDYPTWSQLSAGLATAIVDIAGDNNIVYYSDVWSTGGGWPRDSRIDIVLGAGSDSVLISDYFSDWNISGAAYYSINLGDGENSLTVNLGVGYFDATILGGNEVDRINFNFYGYEANDNGLWYDMNMQTHGGDDVVAITLDGGQRHGGSGGEATILLGDGNDSLDLRCDLGGHLIVDAGNGDDVVSVEFRPADDWPEDAVEIDLGDGANSVDLTFLNISNAMAATVRSGSGIDIITISGGSGTTISSGGDTDTITAGSGADTISAGTGADTITIAKSIFDTNINNPQQTLTLTDFKISDLDTLKLTGFTLTGSIADGIINTAADLTALKTPAGDALSFVQVGADAVLTLNLGGGETGKILFQNLTIPTLDAPRSFVGTAANNIFVGGNNADQFFLKLGQDRATGNAGADVFRVNAVTSHNNNGDRHTITDLNFAEGDVLRFDNFGPAWANNAADPLNNLVYVAGSFNNWFVDSLADLRELRLSGAITTTALAGGAGTRISFEDQAGDDMQIDLLGLIV